MESREQHGIRGPSTLWVGQFPGGTGDLGTVWHIPPLPFQAAVEGVSTGKEILTQQSSKVGGETDSQHPNSYPDQYPDLWGPGQIPAQAWGLKGIWGRGKATAKGAQPEKAAFGL